MAQLGGERSSWTAPLDATRLVPGERPESVAVRQLRALAPLLPAEPVPPFVFDAGFNPAALTTALADVRAAVLVRFRGDRMFFRAPPPHAGPGRLRRHGAPFRCAVEATWGDPDLDHAEEDAACGRVEVRCWRGLHGRPARRMTGPRVGRESVAEPRWLWSCPRAMPLEDIARTLGFADEPVSELGARSWVDREAVMDRLTADFPMPEYFGRNWDAVDECVADLCADGRLIVVRDIHPAARGWVALFADCVGSMWTRGAAPAAASRWCWTTGRPAV